MANDKKNQRHKSKKPSYTVWNNMRFIIGNLGKWDKNLLILCGFRIPALVLLPLSAIYLPKLVIDELTAKASPERLIAVVGGYTLIVALLNAFDSYANGKIEWSAQSYRLRYINLISIKTMDTDYENIDNEKGQAKLQKALNNVNNNDCGTVAIIISLVQIIASCLGFILYGSIISMLNPLVVILLIITTSINYLMLRYVRNYEHGNKDNWAPIDKKIYYIETRSGEFSNGKDIRLYGMVDWFQKMHSFFINERLSWTKRVTWRHFLSNIVDGILIFFRDGVAYGYLIYMILAGKLSVADFVLFFGAVAGFSSWLSGIINQVNEINVKSLDLCDLRDYLDMPDRFNRGKGIPLPKEDDVPCNIEFKNITFSYPGSENNVIENFNLKISKGEKLAIVGINGAGKTTLIKLLCGLYHPSSGEILLNGNNICKYNRDEYYTLFSAVFQDIRIMPVSVAKNVALCNENKINRERVIMCLELSGLKEKIDTLSDGIDTMLMKNINEIAIDLSGGEMQKLVLARALYKNAPIIVLDEPTAALDPIAENELYLKYGDLTKHKTSIFISHRLSSTRFCDRIVFLNNGNIAELGSHDELMNINGKYAQMFEIQSHYYKENIGGEANV
ncbi:ABC transporter ATP-binding protein [Clostridium akagii]|uniref:ABC transporter ATP-binding protein n=1 Tax=Clostridium akagii TaxID=91623 RepID=UPI00047CE17B|nr:ABC transporter ATP-binding protein [Clostridium akagii]